MSGWGRLAISCPAESIIRDVDGTLAGNATAPANSPQPLHFSQELSSLSRSSSDLDLDRLALFFRLDFDLIPPATSVQHILLHKVREFVAPTFPSFSLLAEFPRSRPACGPLPLPLSFPRP
jgi:hypothetical protein